MKRRQHKLSGIAVFADGSTMTEAELISQGRVIRAEDNMEVELEARRIFHPEYAEEAKKVAKFERAEKRRQELMAELAKLESI